MITEPAISLSRLLFLSIANTIYKILDYSASSIDSSYNIAASDLESSSISF
jgi:hypothetical protein